MEKPYNQHLLWMKPKETDWYQERYNFYIEHKNFWQKDYQEQKSNNKVKNENEYIHKKINDFIN